MRFHTTLCRVSLILPCLLAFVSAMAQENRATYLRTDYPREWNDSDNYPTSPVDEEWWRAFDDTLLDSLVAIGVKNNFDARAAARRIDIARAAVRQTQSGYFPQINLSAGWSRQRQSGRIASSSGDATTLSWWNGGATMNWEIDVFGKVRRLVNESKKSLQITAAEYNGVMLALEAEIVTTYINLLVNRAQLDVANEHSENQKHILNITETRFKTGLVSKLDVAQAKTLYYSTIASIPMLESSIDGGYNALAVLLGVTREQLPSDVFSAHPIPASYQLAGMNTPIEVIRSRPDVVAAEKNIDLAAAQLGVARSAYLPSLSVSASLGTSAHSVGDLFSRQSLTYNVSPTLSWTLFDGLNRRYATAQAKENMEVMIDNYNMTVLTAIEEVRNAMADYKATLRYIESIEMVVDNSKEAVTLSLDRYTQGLTDFYNVVEAQLNYLAYQNSLVAARGKALVSLTDLYKALGGGINR